MKAIDIQRLQVQYSTVLHHGLLIVRDCLTLNAFDWAIIEVEHLHNLPSLMNENNVFRHRYYYEKERTSYLDLLADVGPTNVKTRVKLIYEPAWLEINLSLGLRTFLGSNPCSSVVLGHQHRPTYRFWIQGKLRTRWETPMTRQ